MSVRPSSGELNAYEVEKPPDEPADEQAGKIAPADELAGEDELEAPGLKILRSPSDPTTDEIEMHEAAGHSPYSV